MSELANVSTLEGPRPARLEERDELLAMINHIFRTLAGREPTVATDWAHVYAPENLENVMVVSDQGKLVASTGLWVNEVQLGDVRLRVGGINCVGTLPDYRRHGLGSGVVEAAQARMRDLGCHVGLLVTGISGWYRRLGWEDAGIVRSYQLNRGNFGYLPRLPESVQARFVDIRQGDPQRSSNDGDILAQIVDLHNREKMGALRSIESFRQRLAAKRISRVVVAERVGQSERDGLVAYGLLRENSLLSEWAGAAECVAGLARACFEMMDNPQASTSQRGDQDGGAVALRHLTLTTPGWQHPLHKLLDEVRIPYRMDYLGMIYVVDPRALLDAFGLSVIEVNEANAVNEDSAAGEAFTLSYQNEQVTLKRSQLAKLFFGPERVNSFAADVLPLPFWQWHLEVV